MNLVFLTDDAHPNGTADDRLALPHLRTLGAEVEFQDWQRPSGHDHRPRILRSPWNYQRQPEPFLAALSAYPNLWNPLEVVRWNADKSYLGELSDQGVPTIPTCTVPAAELARALPRQPWPKTVVKPSVSAGGEATYCLNRDQALPLDLQAAIAAAPQRSFLVQPFLPTVQSEGEYSMILFGGIFSHAVVKRPAHGNFLIHEEHGGSTLPASVPESWVSLSQQALGLAPAPCLYARADWIRGPTGPLLVELELIEPSLYLAHAPNAAKRWAEALLAGVVQ